MPGALRLGAFAVADAGGARARGIVRRADVSGGARGSAIDVAVCIVRAPDGRVLVAERTARQVAAGFWELPGGKIDRGETAAQGARRELAEEVGIEAAALRPAIVYEHAFPLKRVRLHFFRIDAWTGTPHGREGQRLAWIDPAAPHVRPILPSNDRVLKALGLAPILLLTPGTDGRRAAAFCSGLPAALRPGNAAVAVREPRLTPDGRVQYARRIAALARPFGTQVVIAGSALEAQRSGADGVLSQPADVRRLDARPPVALWIAGCRDGEGADRAVALGADAVIWTPASAPVTDWDALRRLVATLPVPVYVDAGLHRDQLTIAQHAGAAGIVCGDAAAPAA